MHAAAGMRDGDCKRMRERHASGEVAFNTVPCTQRGKLRRDPRIRPAASVSQEIAECLPSAARWAAKPGVNVNAAQSHLVGRKQSVLLARFTAPGPRGIANRLHTSIQILLLMLRHSSVVRSQMVQTTSASVSRKKQPSPLGKLVHLASAAIWQCQRKLIMRPGQRRLTFRLLVAHRGTFTWYRHEGIVSSRTEEPSSPWTTTMIYQYARSPPSASLSLVDSRTSRGASTPSRYCTVAMA